MNLECSLNRIDFSFLVNMSDNPNIVTIDDGVTFITTREIKSGEELTTN